MTRELAVTTDELMDAVSILATTQTLDADRLINDAEAYLRTLPPLGAWANPDEMRAVWFIRALIETLKRERTGSYDEIEVEVSRARARRIRGGSVTPQADTQRPAGKGDSGFSTDGVIVQTPSGIVRKPSGKSSVNRPQKRVRGAVQKAMNYLIRNPKAVEDTANVTSTTLAKKLRIGRSSAGEALKIMRTTGVDAPGITDGSGEGGES